MYFSRIISIFFVLLFSLTGLHASQNQTTKVSDPEALVLVCTTLASFVIPQSPRTIRDGFRRDINELIYKYPTIATELKARAADWESRQPMLVELRDREEKAKQEQLRRKLQYEQEKNQKKLEESQKKLNEALVAKRKIMEEAVLQTVQQNPLLAQRFADEERKIQELEKQLAQLQKVQK